MLRYPVLTYFLITVAISWVAALCVALPSLLHGGPLPTQVGILMFPAMLLGPSITGVLLTWMMDGAGGLRELSGRLRRWPTRLRYYGMLLIPPALVLVVLSGLRHFFSPAFSANRFYLGVLFGVPAGILEELGWTGFAFPRLRAQLGTSAAALALGVMWALWHLPVADFLGAARPHGHYWLAFFGAFAAAMIAIRVLISWAYSGTGSLPIAQLLHISSTGALVVLGPPHLTPREEVTWYGVYAFALWAVVGGAMVCWRGGASAGPFVRTANANDRGL